MDTSDLTPRGAESIDGPAVEVPTNMTAEADAHQALPGGEAIPADLPDSPHGDISLEYTLQNFNALVAANTAMIGEISSLNTLNLERAKTEDHLRGWLGDRGETIERLNAALKERDATLKDLKGEKQEARDDADFAGRQRDTLQRRLDRSLGYLDRVLDDEDGIRAPEHRTMPAPKPPVGPALGEIPDPIRPTRQSEDSAFAHIRSWSPGEHIETYESRRRRY